MANEIFVSYADEDHGFAVKLDHALRNIRIDPWIDIDDLVDTENRRKHTLRGILNARAYVFVISPDSLEDPECLFEAQTAIKEGKQLIPVFLRGNSGELFGKISNILPELGDINAIYFNNPDSSFQDSFDLLLASIRGDFFLANEVFISYSRKNLDIIKMIDTSLRNRRIDAWVDWEDIPPGADWRKKIFDGIANAHTFLFHLSQASANSGVCKEELLYAIKHSKRIIPILLEELPETSIPEEIKDLETVSFIGVPFEEAFDQLCRRIDEDLEYMRYHTQLQHKAMIQWAQKGKQPYHLLGGRDLEEAHEFLLQGETKSLKPTALQREFIEKSQIKEEISSSKNVMGQYHMKLELREMPDFDAPPQEFDGPQPPMSI